MDSKKFLQFNEKKVYLLSTDGVWWIAIRPICEALGVNYNRAFQNLKEDKILGQLFAMRQMVAADNKVRQMVCLPEFYIYGWIFQLQSDSPQLLEYKWECYKVLHNHFHGTLTERMSLLREKSSTEQEIERLEGELKQTEPYKRLLELRSKVSSFKKGLTKLDQESIQLELWQ